MTHAANALLPRIRNRVTYRGTTYTICTYCYALIGSGKREANLLAMERSHHCAATESEHDIPREFSEHWREVRPWARD
jgi:hypothetical protein